MDSGQSEGGSKSSNDMKNYQTEPLEKSKSQTNHDKKPDPYVIRAMNRAKAKIRDRIFQLNGGHVH